MPMNSVKRSTLSSVISKHVNKIRDFFNKRKRQPWLRMNGVILLLPPHDFIACRWTTDTDVSGKARASLLRRVNLAGKKRSEAVFLNISGTKDS
jgi:hypothetical protein